MTLQKQLNKNLVLHSIKQSLNYGTEIADNHQMILLDFNCSGSKYILQTVCNLRFTTFNITTQF